MAAVVLVGNPNVGKSVIFNCLTGRYATVSNYPGTTVDILNGHSRLGARSYDVIDTPGLYSLIPITEEEEVTRRLLTDITAQVVIHVIDAKNIRRMLALTLQFMEAGLPVILTINMIDEARKAGLSIDGDKLSVLLSLPVVGTTAVKGYGIEILKENVAKYQYQAPQLPCYSADIEHAIDAICSSLRLSYGMNMRAVALLLLSGDRLIERQVKREAAFTCIEQTVRLLAEQYELPLAYVIIAQRQHMVDAILEQTVTRRVPAKASSSGWLDWCTRQSLTGIPILCLVLYFGLYQAVGKFGAGTLVDFIDYNIFTAFVTPTLLFYVKTYIPYLWLQSLLVGEYGVFTLGIRYAIVIILPVVGMFFLVFSMLEDSGYLPRLAMLADSVFKKFGLNGRAVIPLTLGTGCGTMAVMVTRTLESRRERVLATFLLALAIPCSAQLGVILSLLAHNSRAVMVWAVYLGMVLATAGWISARLLPGERSSFYIELPPLRLPLASNIIQKAWTRMCCYFAEILPIFIITSLVIWGLAYWGLLELIVATAKPLMRGLGLPPEAAPAFIQGFFRRDYGAAGLYDLCSQGALSDRQLLVAAITLTLFVPCVAQLSVMIKERGVLAAICMTTAIVVIAMGSGWLVNCLLTLYPLL